MEPLARFLFFFFVFFACALICICVHEFGHYLAGWLSGIPAKNMRIRLLKGLAHVALRSDGTWVAPTDGAKYIELVWQNLKTSRRIYLYVAGGGLLETTFLAIVASLLMLFGQPRLALALVSMSCVLFVSYLVFESIMIVRGRVFGDFSGLWHLSPYPTAVFILVMAGVRGVLLWWAW